MDYMNDQLQSFWRTARAGSYATYYMSIVNKYINSPLVDESEMGTCSSSIPTLPALEILAESSDFWPVQATQDFIVDGSTLIRSTSMLNYHVSFGDTVVNLDVHNQEQVRFGNAIVNLNTHNPEQNTCDGIRDEVRLQDVVADMQPRRNIQHISIWSRINRFVRSLFCLSFKLIKST